MPICIINGCKRGCNEDSKFCFEHHNRALFLIEGQNQDDRYFENDGNDISRIISDHIKINIEQSAKGARCTVTYDRSDHDIEVAIQDAVLTYGSTIKALKDEGLKVDES